MLVQNLCRIEPHLTIAAGAFQNYVEIDRSTGKELGHAASTQGLRMGYIGQGDKGLVHTQNLTGHIYEHNWVDPFVEKADQMRCQLVHRFLGGLLWLNFTQQHLRGCATEQCGVDAVGPAAQRRFCQNGPHGGIRGSGHHSVDQARQTFVFKFRGEGGVNQLVAWPSE